MSKIYFFTIALTYEQDLIYYLVDRQWGLS